MLGLRASSHQTPSGRLRPPQSREEVRTSALIHRGGDVATATKQGKEERRKAREGRTLFAADKIAYVEKSQGIYKKAARTKNFSKVTECKVDTQNTKCKNATVSQVHI